MSLFSKFKNDPLLGKVIRSSGALFSSNTISLGLSVVQSILAARLLGPAGFGLVAIVMSYASTVNGFLSFRMSELVVRYGGEYLEKDEKEKTAALVKAAALSEATVSLLAFIVCRAHSHAWLPIHCQDSEHSDTFYRLQPWLAGELQHGNIHGCFAGVGENKISGRHQSCPKHSHGRIDHVLHISQMGICNSSCLPISRAKSFLGIGIFVTAFFQLHEKTWERLVEGGYQLDPEGQRACCVLHSLQT